MNVADQPAAAPMLRAVRGFFFLAGIGMSAWAIIAPAAKIKFGLSDGALGLTLFAAGIGGVIAMPFGGLAMARLGSRIVLLVASLLLGLLLPALALAPSATVFAVLFFIYGFVFGLVDVAMNTQGPLAETLSGGRQMSLFHAFFSIGGLAVALGTSLLLRAGATGVFCAAATCLTALLILPQARHLLPRRYDEPAEGRRLAWPNRAVAVLGFCCFVCFLTEGAVTDWSTIFLRFSRQMPLASAAFGYAAFEVAMTASRLFGDRVVVRLGPVAVMRLGCGLAVLGLLLAVALPYGLAGIVGFGLVGLGAGNIAPLIFSAAGRVPGMAASLSMPAVVGLGYIGFLIGPVVIGLVAQRLNLSVAFEINAALLITAFLAAEAVAG